MTVWATPDRDTMRRIIFQLQHPDWRLLAPVSGAGTDGKWHACNGSEWIWSAEPTHTPLADIATWDAAQRIGRRHGNVRDPEIPPARTGRRYKLRFRCGPRGSRPGPRSPGA